MRDQPINHQLLTSRSVARRLDVGADRVRQLSREGRLQPAAVTESGQRLYTQETVDRFIAERAAALTSSR
jgi:DNA-binding transcriptional MerR regulator